MTESVELNLKQEEFCKLYVSPDKDFFGNWVQSYIEVYKPDMSKKNWYKTCLSASSRLLTNVKVIARINELLEEGWLNDQFVDRQLLFLMQQYGDLWSKMSAIKEYNKVKQRITSNVNLSWGLTIDWQDD